MSQQVLSRLSERGIYHSNILFQIQSNYMCCVYSKWYRAHERMSRTTQTSTLYICAYTSTLHMSITHSVCIYAERVCDGQRIINCFIILILNSPYQNIQNEVKFLFFFFHKFYQPSIIFTVSFSKKADLEDWCDTIICPSSHLAVTKLCKYQY